MHISLNVLFSPSIFTQEHQHSWKSENSFPTLKFFSDLRNFLWVLQRVNWSSWAFWIIQCFSRSFNQIKSWLCSTCNHQVVIGMNLTISCLNNIILGPQILNCLLHPIDPWIEKRFTVSDHITVGRLPHSSSNIDVAWLIVVHLLRVKNRNFSRLIHTCIDQLRRNRVSSRTCPNDGNSRV